MVICLDTNVWIFGLLRLDALCSTIVDNGTQFNLRVANQVRIELERNLPIPELQRFYQLLNDYGCDIDYEPVPEEYVLAFQEKGLKKGDAIIGAFCEWRNVDILVSHNRDFLRGLAPSHHFEVLSPLECCHRLNLLD